jgi:hypothetical protein
MTGARLIRLVEAGTLGMSTLNGQGSSPDPVWHVFVCTSSSVCIGRQTEQAGIITEVLWCWRRVQLVLAHPVITRLGCWK